MNKYNLVARVYPAILCSLPILLLNYFLLRYYTATISDSLAQVKWPGDVSITVVAMFMLAQAGRFIGKHLYEQTYFADELRMPTTDLLMHGDSSLSPEYKEQIRVKIHTEAGLTLHSQEKERLDHMAARRVIVDGVRHVRSKVKNGRLLLQHNIEYGFVRNMIGGSVIAAFISIGDLLVFGYFFPNQTAFVLSLVLATVYLALMCLGRPLMFRYGKTYAKVLFQEYLAA